jgi:hypothetical protein
MVVLQFFGKGFGAEGCSAPLVSRDDYPIKSLGDMH